MPEDDKPLQHPGMTNESGHPVSMWLRPPQTYMGAWVLEFEDRGKFIYIALDRSALKWLQLKLLEVS